MNQLIKKIFKLTSDMSPGSVIPLLLFQKSAQQEVIVGEKCVPSSNKAHLSKVLAYEVNKVTFPSPGQRVSSSPQTVVFACSHTSAAVM